MRRGATVSGCRIPDLENDWENVLRAAMHGRHLPILAALPTDTVWFKVEGGITAAELGTLRTR